MSACRLAPIARTAYDARLRQLQRHGLAARDDSATGRLCYGIAELAAFATATRLMDAFMVPALAARYVTEKWAEVGAAALAGARDALPIDYALRRTIVPNHFLVLGSNALAKMGERHRHDERYTAALGPVTCISEKDVVQELGAVGGGGIVIDTRTYMAVVVREWRERLNATDTEVTAELDRLRRPV